MNRLYLVDAEEYRIRYLDGSVVRARWRDAGMRFVAGRGDERREVRADRIAAVSTGVPIGRARIAPWWPFDQCFRARHMPPAPAIASTWRHPYRSPSDKHPHAA